MKFDKFNYYLDNMSSEEWETFIKEREVSMKRKEILAKYNIKPLKGSRQGWWATVGGKQVKKTIREDLESYIVQFERKRECTLSSIFEDFRRYRIEKDEIDSETIRKYDYFFNTFLKYSSLGNTPLKDIRIKDGKEFQDYVKKIKPDAKLRYWKNQHGIINKMFEYAINLELVDHNPLKDLKDNPSIHYWHPTITKAESDLYYNDEEMVSIIRIAFQDYEKKGTAIPLGIVILFCLAVRVGELCGLKWRDISPTNVTIRQQYTSATLKDVKSDKSRRSIIIDSNVYHLFQLIKESNCNQGFPTSENDFVFLRRIRQGKNKGDIALCTDRCFNGRLEYYCPKIGIPIKSTHDIRRTSLTNIYKECKDIEIVQKIAGHSSSRMTEHYIQLDCINTRDTLNQYHSNISTIWNDVEWLKNK